MFAESGDVQRVFVRSVSFGFGNGLRSAYDFLDGRLVSRFFLVLGFFLVEFDFFLVFVNLFLFKNGAASCRVGVDFFANEVLLGVDDACGENGCFLFTDRNFTCCGDFVFRINVCGIGFANFFRFGLGKLARWLNRFRRSAGEEPTGQSTS